MEAIPLSVEKTSCRRKNNSDVLNVIHIGLSFLLIFMSFSVSQTFQTSSDHAREGAIALGILYASYSISSLFFSSYLTRLFGVKLTLIICSLVYALFAGGNIKFNTYVFYSIAFLLGIGSSLIWTAQGVYVSLSSSQHESVNQLDPSSKRGYFNGIFFCCYQLNTTMGFSIASLLFYFDIKPRVIFITMTIISLCGSISLIFLRKVDTKHLQQRSIFSSIALLKESRQLFLAPLICYTGIQVAYLHGVLPPLIVSNSFKFLVYASYGASSAISSLLFGKLSDFIHNRIYLFLLGATFHLLAYMLLISIWLPPIDQNEVYIFLLIVNFFAIGDGIILPQIYSVLGTFFSDTRPFDIFANFKLFQASFIAIGFLYKNYFTFQIQTYLCIASLLIGIWLLIICHKGFYSIDDQDISDNTTIESNDSDKDKTIQSMLESEQLNLLEV